MTIDEMKQRKIELGMTNAELSGLSGVALGTINKIFSGATKAPRSENILAIESVLNRSSIARGTPYPEPAGNALMLCEPAPAYQAGTSPVKKMPGEFTLEDYLALPDDVRVELIDGVFYDMAAPHATHQFIAIQIGYQLLGHVEKNHGPCKPVLSPIDVQIDKDDKTVVQPDVVLLCNPKSYLKNGRIFGAPDFVIEILSPSTRKRDMTLKLQKYSNAGVKELWYVDPKNLKILVYDLQNEAFFPKTYTFEDKVPVLIWNSEFSVDFNAVYEYAKDYLDQ